MSQLILRKLQSLKVKQKFRSISKLAILSKVVARDVFLELQTFSIFEVFASQDRVLMISCKRSPIKVDY